MIFEEIMTLIGRIIMIPIRIAIDLICLIPLVVGYLIMVLISPILTGSTFYDQIKPRIKEYLGE